MSNPIDDADATLRSFGFEWKVEFNITVTQATNRPSDSGYAGSTAYDGSFVFNFVGMYFPTKCSLGFFWDHII